MRNFLLTFVAIVTIMAIASCATAEERAARQAENLKMVKASVGNQQYRINITSMTPMRGTRTTVTGRYLKIDGKKIDCSLPYVGREDIPHLKTRGEMRMDSKIEFRGETEDYVLQYQPKKKQGVITFKITYGGEDHRFKIVVDEMGHARIHMVPEGRDYIDYEGDVSHL